MPARISLFTLVLPLVGAAFLGACTPDVPEPSQELRTESPADSTVTIEWLLTDRSAGRGVPAARWLPDGSRVIVTVDGFVELLHVDSGARERLVQGAEGVPSPDGRRVAYAVREVGEAQLWVRSVDRDDARPITAIPGGLGEQARMTFAWSPDSRMIAFAFRPPAAVGEAEAPTSGTPAPSVIVIGEEGDVPPDSELWTVEVDSRSARQVVTGAHHFAALSWMPDGESVVYGAHRTFEWRADDNFGEIRRTLLADGTTTTLARDAGVQVLNPTISPDGKRIAFLYDPANQVYPYHRSVAVVGSEGGEIRQLTFDVMVGGMQWSPGGEEVFFVGRDGVFRQLFSVTMEGEVRRWTEGERNVLSPTVSPDGRRIAWGTEDALGRRVLWAAPLEDLSAATPLLDAAPGVHALRLGEVREFRWRSRDGLGIAGLVVLPPGYDGKTEYPLMLTLHGGPVGGVSLSGTFLQSPMEWQMWAAKGFIVFVPEFRSSVTFGWDEVLKARERQDADDRDYDDIMSGLDHVMGTYPVDTSKMVVLGHSYGAHLTNWILTKTDRFRVAVSYEGNAERYMAWGSGSRVGGNSIAQWLFGGLPWEVPANYRNATADHVGKIRTPTLLISGDQGIPLYHNQFLYSALRTMGVETGLLVYEGEGHVIQRPENRRDLIYRVEAWIESHLSRL